MIQYYKGIPIKDIIYHGTIHQFDEVDTNKGKNYKDFGKGFYLAFKKEQSVKLAQKYIRKEHLRSGVVYSYQTNVEEFQKLVDVGRVKYFKEADYDWIDFVLRSRDTRGVWHNYDIVIGPTADDDTKYCLNMYKQGEYGPVGSELAKQVLLNNLEIDNLGVQVFIANENGLRILNQITRKTERVTL
jgi:hypothetical protein